MAFGAARQAVRCLRQGCLRGGRNAGGQQPGVWRQVDGGGRARRRHGNRGMSGGFVPCGSGARLNRCHEQWLRLLTLGSLKVKFVEAIKPEGGDVDITSQTKLVSVGRGIGGKENIELAEELAEKLDAALSCSRPVVDAGWLPRTRQVGKSGLKVKPKLYLMLGISGAPEHLEGMKSAELIIAINTDKKAPIFNVAHYGATADLFEVAEAMLELL
jgi:hypothetical protein